MLKAPQLEGTGAGVATASPEPGSLLAAPCGPWLCGRGAAPTVPVNWSEKPWLVERLPLSRRACALVPEVVSDGYPTSHRVLDELPDCLYLGFLVCQTGVLMPISKGYCEDSARLWVQGTP